MPECDDPAQFPQDCRSAVPMRRLPPARAASGRTCGFKTSHPVGQTARYACTLGRQSPSQGSLSKKVTVQGSDPPSEQRGCSNLAAMAAYRFREVTQHVTLLPLAGLGDRE